ncbi:MAG: glycosyltransferase family 4 protein [Sulfurimonas sp.]|uniref:glycosyltransferase family 4 protein n=1 Tax=Sulfurimonas sp. TaxID=2022749 RepID=UPI0025E72B29|nr:glycosyltransferase family 4 protein [Sulfurimonas sp.]MCK9455065.1 glycosyltransferase family 4 protein [Sulfurimonas sp.]
MNILIFTSTGDISTFNSQRPELEIYVSLAKNGHKLVLMAQDNGIYCKRLIEHGVEIVHALHSKKIDLKNIILAKKIIKEKKIDILYATSSRGISNAIFASLFTDVKLVTYRGTTGGLYRYDPSAYLNALNPRVDGVVCVSESVERHVKKQLFSNTQKAVTIYKGHDVEWYDQAPANLGEFKTDKNNFNVAFVGNVRPHKGLIYVLEAMKYVSDLQNLHLLLIGDKISQEPHASSIKNSGMSERIHITGYRSDVPSIISACDILIHASTRKEGLPRVILESLASGTPVIASANESSLEIIEDSVNGFIVPIKDAKAIAQKIRELYDSPQTLQNLKEHAKDVIKNKMSHENTVKKYIEYFESLLKK